MSNQPENNREQRPRIVSDIAEKIVKAAQQLKVFASKYVTSRTLQRILNEDRFQKRKVKTTGGLNDRIRQDNKIARQEREKQREQRRERIQGKKGKVVQKRRDKKYADIGSFDKDFKEKSTQKQNRQKHSEKHQNGKDQKSLNGQDKQKQNSKDQEKAAIPRQQLPKWNPKRVDKPASQKTAKKVDKPEQKNSQKKYDYKTIMKQKNNFKQTVDRQRQQQRQLQYRYMGDGPLKIFLQKNKRDYKARPQCQNMGALQFMKYLEDKWKQLQYKQKSRYMEYYRKSQKFQKMMVQIREKQEKSRPISDKFNVIKNSCTVDGKFDKEKMLLSFENRTNLSAIQASLLTLKQKDRFYHQKPLDKNVIELQSQSEQSSAENQQAAQVYQEQEVYE